MWNMFLVEMLGNSSFRHRSTIWKSRCCLQPKAAQYEHDASAEYHRNGDKVIFLSYWPKAVLLSEWMSSLKLLQSYLCHFAFPVNKQICGVWCILLEQQKLFWHLVCSWGIGQTNKRFQNVLGLLELIPSNYKKHLGSFKSARHICCFLHAGFEVHYLTTNYCFSFSSGRRVPQWYGFPALLGFIFHRWWLHVGVEIFHVHYTVFYNFDMCMSYANKALLRFFII